MLGRPIRAILPWIVLVVGILAIILNLSAGYFHLDVDQKWGPIRTIGLITGFLLAGGSLGHLMITALDLFLLAQSDTNFIQKVNIPFPLATISWIEAIAKTSRRGQSRKKTRLVSKQVTNPSSVHRRIFVSIILLIIPILYLGISTTWNWTWTPWQERTNFYSLLAQAFRHGSFALQIDPDPRLAQLEDPYNQDERADIPYLWDASYFDDKYYIYWGPVPSIFLIPLETVIGRSVGDEIIVYSAIVAIFVFSTFILIKLRNTYFPRIPNWLFAATLILIAIAYPILWILTWPKIYEAAIASGQAFLLAALLVALPIIDGSSKEAWRYLLIGVLLSFSLGSRLTLLGAILCLITSISFQTIRKSTMRRSMRLLSTLGVPLMFGVLSLGFYNYSRFGNVFETGVRYQLNYGLTDIFEQGLLIRSQYVFPNLLYYLFTPLRLISQFPFVRPIWGKLDVFTNVLIRLSLPDTYHVEIISGILIVTPAIVFSALPIWTAIFNPLRERFNGIPTPSEVHSVDFRVMIFTIFFIGIFAGGPLLLIFWVTSRYLLDATPLFMILAVVGSWQFFEASRQLPVRRRIYSLIIISLIAISIALSIILTFTGKGSNFDDLNPELFQLLFKFFSG